MTTTQIADQLISYCRKGEWTKAQEELYADDAVSIEPYASPHFEKETKGLPALMEKSGKFTAMTETLHSSDISDPLITDNAIAFKLTLDATMKERGRNKFTEICVYEVKDGKIISERFFM